MITSEWLYWLIGAFFITVAVFIVVDTGHAKRFGNAAFWGILGISFYYGTFVAAGTAPAWVLGIAVLVMVALAGAGLTGTTSRTRVAAVPGAGTGAPTGPAEPTGAVPRAADPADAPTGRAGRFAATGSASTSVLATTSPEERAASARRFGNRLFVPALVVPVVAVLVATLGPLVHVGGQPLLAEGSATLTGLGVGSVLAAVVAVFVLRPPSVATPVREGGRLLQAIGWAALLPQMLSTLGIVFTQAGVGAAVGTITEAVLPEGSLFAAVVLYCVGMALFTVIMGNAFAAFPIMTAAIGWPVLVQGFDGNPAAIFAIGMLAGFCGTLATPMAANFNLVPAALLEMRDKYGPIKAQLPTAVVLLVVNTGIMYLVAF
ncbi:DUF979 domain-containing protein [Curtobacterium sp. MCSS17_008]|uniref:DUF979 domain-containing protein n=1 Tax=Curtobacterium sp. MCSS17_008 TaxID=2175647 RepID=UPI000DA818A8|nr:DUF979 domain-containing protein [Curtobacterium sp. MCSS17_008]PZF58185.1 DUF979 domain-containing protein [Curtobacterium sp. MCSS17_008]